MSFFDDLVNGLFGGGSNAPNEAMNYYNNIPGVVKPYFDPYINAGQNQLPNYQNTVNNMLSDPTGFINSIMDTYYESPQYQFEKGQAITSADNAAALGGTLGTGAHQGQVADYVRQLSSEDQQRYLQNTLGVQNTGLQGSQNLISGGYNAGNTLSQILAQNQRDLGSLGYDSAQRRTSGGIEGIAGLAQLGASAFGGIGGGFGNSGIGQWFNG